MKYPYTCCCQIRATQWFGFPSLGNGFLNAVNDVRRVRPGDSADLGTLYVISVGAVS